MTGVNDRGHLTADAACGYYVVKESMFVRNARNHATSLLTQLHNNSIHLVPSPHAQGCRWGDLCRSDPFFPQTALPFSSQPGSAESCHHSVSTLCHDICV